MKQFQKIQIIQDRNDHWYAIPVEKIGEFKADDITMSLNWTRKYSQYMLGISVHNLNWVELYIEKKDIDTIDN